MPTAKMKEIHELRFNRGDLPGYPKVCKIKAKRLNGIRSALGVQPAIRIGSATIDYLLIRAISHPTNYLKAQNKFQNWELSQKLIYFFTQVH